jgi:uncharacterized lipoprotein YddW (UPF0748 family)
MKPKHPPITIKPASIFLFVFVVFAVAQPVFAQPSKSVSGTPQRAFGTPQAAPIRGTWITNVASDVLRSRENIKKAVLQSKAAGLTDLFVVVWNKGVTMYPSKVLNSYIQQKQDTNYLGRDPLQEIIEEAHKEGLRVHAWFEFGFSYAYKDSNNTWVNRFPDWVGRDSKGGALQKNGFFWWNALHPGPQKLLKQLVLEVVKNYAVDGIQGDDRLPAMPAEGGYDTYTQQRYKQERGLKVPADPKAESFLQWKADKLSEYGKELYLAVKKQRPGCIVSWAPSIFPWSKEQYLQDWPTWLKDGYADYIIPQLYRYKIGDYEKVLSALVDQVPKELRSRVFPGILTSLGDGYQATTEMMQEMIALNRKYGFQGEVFFYFETMNRNPISYQ